MPATERPFFIFAATLSRRSAALSRARSLSAAAVAADAAALAQRVRFDMLAHSLAHINMAAQCEVAESERHAGRACVCVRVQERE